MTATFLKKRINLSETGRLKKLLRAHGLNTVCESALCPNIGECFAKRTTTFLICGDVCTRGCGFCGIGKGNPAPLDPSEPSRVAEAVKALGLRYVVITSVTRDDLPDGGAGHFAGAVSSIREGNPGVRIEVLVPDFKGNTDSAETVFKAEPDVFSHNIETVPSLYAKARPGSDYARSLGLLKLAFKKGLTVKSGLMMGMGETVHETVSCLKDIRASGCSIITVGQYLAPTKNHFPVTRHLSDAEFESLKDSALKLGFEHCASGTYVRSSYLAETMLAKPS